MTKKKREQPRAWIKLIHCDLFADRVRMVGIAPNASVVVEVRLTKTQAVHDPGAARSEIEQHELGRVCTLPDRPLGFSRKTGELRGRIGGFDALGWRVHCDSMSAIKPKENEG